MSPEKKKLTIIIASVSIALIIALIPIIIIIVGGTKTDDPESDVPDDVLSGTYVLDLPPSISRYTFSEGNKVTNVYSYPKDTNVDEDSNLSPDTQYELKTDEYTYEIVKLDGKNYIELTPVSGGEKKTIRFNYGSYERVHYFCETEQCITNDDGGSLDDPREGGSEYCKYHTSSKIYEQNVKKSFICFGEDDEEVFYYKAD